MADVERYLLAAQGAAKRAAALTHRLLAFSRRQTLDPKPTDVAALVGGMEDLVSRTVGPAIAVESVMGAGLWTVQVDPNQLENALLNLAINARDAMPDGGKLTVEAANRWLDDRAAREREPPPRPVRLALRVRHRLGHGARRRRSRVRSVLHHQAHRRGHGAGPLHGLRLRAAVGRAGAPLLGGGARHDRVLLPAAPPRRGGRGPRRRRRGRGRASGGVDETVLVIDDEPLVRMLVVDVLEELGYATLEAGDGPEGLKLLRSPARVDLLITDVGLPNGLNGRQVADAARGLRPGLKVLFITGYAENAVLNHGHLEHGMSVVTKPFAVEDLGRKVRAILEER